MARPERMTFGVFLAPFHPTNENPTLAFERDLELLEWLDALGYDEAFIGEHHSAGWETIASPEVFHRRRRPAHALHPLRHRRGEHPLPPPVHGRRPHGAARPPDEGVA